MQPKAIAARGVHPGLTGAERCSNSQTHCPVRLPSQLGRLGRHDSVGGLDTALGIVVVGYGAASSRIQLAHRLTLWVKVANRPEPVRWIQHCIRSADLSSPRDKAGDRSGPGGNQP